LNSQSDPALEHLVAAHYGSSSLLARILAGLEASGADPDHLVPDDLAAVDEFHIGGRTATAYAISKMGLGAGHHVLDIGCGIGGAARYIAATFGAQVTGIDLTPDYIDVANALSERVGLSKLLRFRVASAVSLPFEDAAFDAAISFHVAMNIADRVTLYAEAARVLQSGATLCIYDVMKKNDDALSFPTPWAQSANTSFLVSTDTCCDLLTAAGFKVAQIEDRTEFAKALFEKSLAAQKNGPVPLGTHLLMGDTAQEKIMNVASNMQAGRIAPVQIIATRN